VAIEGGFSLGDALQARMLVAAKTRKPGTRPKMKTPMGS
jgi:hypothetical protein